MSGVGPYVQVTHVFPTTEALERERERERKRETAREGEKKRDRERREREKRETGRERDGEGFSGWGELRGRGAAWDGGECGARGGRGARGGTQIEGHVTKFAPHRP